MPLHLSESCHFSINQLQTEQPNAHKNMLHYAKS